jgi:hypothetical protein
MRYKPKQQNIKKLKVFLKKLKDEKRLDRVK